MLPVLQAEEQMLAIEAAALPHMKPDAQRDVLDRHRQHLPRPPRRKPTPGELSAAGIRVTNVAKAVTP